MTRAGVLPRGRRQGLPAPVVHGGHLVAQRIGAAAAGKGHRRRGRSGQGGVQNHFFQAPGVAAGRVRGVAAHHLVQGVAAVGQVDHVAGLGVGKFQQVVRRIGRGDGRHVFHKPVGVGDAQAFFAENQGEILPGLGAETEGNQHRAAAQIRQKAGSGPPGHIAVQAGQHVFHAGHAIAVAGQIIAGGKRRRHLAAGEVLQGYAHDLLPVSDCKNYLQSYAKNFCGIICEKTRFFANDPGHAAAKSLRVL